MTEINKFPVTEMADGGRRLTEAEKRTRRMRSIALALALGALVILFYAVTIAKLGANAISSDGSGTLF
jgi:hypothetical protein